jgi:hypothetical protein
VGAALLGLAPLAAVTAGGGAVMAQEPDCGVSPTATIERGGSLAGTLIVKPRCAHPGGQVTIAVRNLGDSAMVHGVCARIQRRSDGGWRDTPWTRNQVCIQIAAITPAGETNPIQSITLPRRLTPGRFRAVLVVSGKGAADPRALGLQGIFRVVRR